MTNIEEAMKKLEEQQIWEAKAKADANIKPEAVSEPETATQPESAEQSEAAEQQEVVETPSTPPAPYASATPEPGRIDEHIISFHHPNSRVSDSFKQFHTMLRNLSEGSTSTLAFTSALAGEGRTTAAVNFAIALASDVPGTVCLVDADLRHPGVHSSLDIHPAQGLADVLTLDVPLESVITQTAVPRLSMISAGNVNGSPSELLRSLKTSRVIAELRERFDYVIFDTSPVLRYPDTILLASHVDGIVMVIKAGKTKRKQVTRALELLAHAGVMGFVLNQASADLAK